MNQPIRVLQELGEEFERAVSQAPPQAQGRGSSRPRSGIGQILRGVPAAAGPALAAGVAIAVVLGALLLVRPAHHQQSTTLKPSAPIAAPAASAVPGRRQLLKIIGVLRRPQTKADLNPKVLPTLGGPGAVLQGTPDLSLMRFATTTPWGERLYFVPMKPPTAQQLADFARRFPGSAELMRARGETLTVFSSKGGGGDGTAASIEAGQAAETAGAGRSFAGGSTATRLILVVPDGVAKVQFVLPRQPQPGVPGVRTYQHSTTVAVPVHDNIAAVQVDRELDGKTPPMIWYSAAGQLIKRIGNFANLNRIVPPPQPGPETQLSRAAERDPSTPNPVWVTPSIGGPHTNFMLHFRVLLNDADYSYRLTGTSCPAITVNGGDGGGGSLGLRGRIWSDVVDAISGQTWCPGTYHLSATVMDLGRHGMLRHPATPFGTATFTVHR